ncbi:GNAT family N-acetyltransferase [uncultured Bacteroides sp.]|uniref:GNAT family N-acetyltransferase n=1 Tax=uncultured Bacteroides sp. TaxID=162156 RepID=UPI002AAA9220|nr:GNAT family N-acetyltransferase [uncultured Bacteroides sp.]
MKIEHDKENGIFQMMVDGVTAYVSYRLVDGGLDIRHTIVPEELGGRGIASALVKAAYDYALENGYKPVATCSYAVVWLKRHPEYHGKTGNDFGGEGTCAV